MMKKGQSPAKVKRVKNNAALRIPPDTLRLRYVSKEMYRTI
jgi:hypothetical protein